MANIAANFSNAQITDFVWPDHFAADTGEGAPAVRAFGSPTTVSQLSGDVGYALSKDRVAQDRDENWETETAFGSSVDAKPMEPSSTSYTLDTKRQESFRLTDQQRSEIEDIVGSDDPVDLATFIGDAIRYQWWLDYHRDVADILSNTNQTNYQNVTAANDWDTSNGTPASDIHSAYDLIAGQVDVAICGLDVCRALQFSDPVREYSGVAIDANDGVVNRGAVEMWLAEVFNISRLIVPEMYFNDDNYRQAGLTFTRPFDGIFWMGSMQALVNIEQENPEPQAETHRPEGKGAEIWYGTRTMEPHPVGDDRLGVWIDSTT